MPKPSNRLKTTGSALRNPLRRRQHSAVRVQDYALSLKPKSSAPEGSTGYTSYDANTDTYTWLPDGRQGRTYTVKEITTLPARDATAQ